MRYRHASTEPVHSCLRDAVCWYVYGVIPTDAVPAQGPAVLKDVPVEVLRVETSALETIAEPIALLASPVPLGLFDTGADGRASGISDPAIAEAHHAVVARACASYPCLPFAFGTIFADIDDMADWLAPRRAILAQALDDVRGCDEWIIALHEDVPDHAAWLLRHDADLRLMAAHAQATDEDAGALLERRIAAMADAVRRVRRGLFAARLASVLDRHTKLPCPDGPYDGCWTALVARNGGADLRSLLAGIADDCDGTGLSISVSGPWPPYGFARRMAGDGAAADQPIP